MFEGEVHGPEFLDGRKVRFNFYGPDIPLNGSVEVLLPGRAPQAMARQGRWWRVEVDGLGHGDLYEFRLNGQDAQIVPDIASRYQPDGIPGPSQLVDFRYLPHERPFQKPSWEKTVIYQLHVGAFSEEGRYVGVEQRLDYIASLGMTAIQLMPIHEIPGARNWGYDVILPFAVTRNYGRPEDLRHFLNAAHAKGLMVLCDVVDNHLGPDQDRTSEYAKGFTAKETPWGKGPDFEDFSISQFYIQQSLEMLRYGFDGIRFDACHALPRNFLDAIELAVHAEYPDRILIQENDRNEVHPLEAGWQGVWAGDFHNAARTYFLGYEHNYYKDYAAHPLGHLVRAFSQGYSYQGQHSVNQDAPRGELSGHLAPECFIVFLENHDQIGNGASNTRFTQLLDPRQADLLMDLVALGPHIPMFFMGEPCAETKFRYFTDLTGELAGIVRQGRRLEFERDPDFDPSRVPDPSDPQSFDDSKLDWAHLEAVVASEQHRRLVTTLKLRQDRVAPLLEAMLALTKEEILGVNQGFDVTFETITGQEFQIIVNFSDTALALTNPVVGEILWYARRDQPFRQADRACLLPHQALFCLRGPPL